MELEGIFPKDKSGIAEVTFLSRHDVRPWMCVTLGFISRSYVMSKYPSLVSIDNRPWRRVTFLTFVGVIFLNIFFFMKHNSDSYNWCETFLNAYYERDVMMELWMLWWIMKSKWAYSNLYEKLNSEKSLSKWTTWPR